MKRDWRGFGEYSYVTYAAALDSLLGHIGWNELLWAYLLELQLV